MRWRAGRLGKDGRQRALRFLRFPNPSAPFRRATHARRRLAHPFQQFLQHRGVVMLLVTGRVQESDPPRAFRKTMELLYRGCALFAHQFFEIALPEHAPRRGIRVEPLPQLVRRRQVAQPELGRRILFRQAARPQTVDEHAHSVRRRSSLVNAFDGKVHAFRIILPLRPVLQAMAQSLLL